MDKALSGRTRRRLRLRLAKCLVEQEECAAKRLAQDDTQSMSPVCEYCPSPNEGGRSVAESDSEFNVMDSECSDHEQQRGFCSENSDEVCCNTSDENDSPVEVSGEESIETSFIDSASLSSSVEDTEETSLLPNDGIPLFPGSHIPSTHFSISLMSFVQRHNLTYACENDLLHLLSIILPSPSNIPSSASSFRSHFVNLSDVVTQRFCGSCSSLLDPHSSCTTPSCVASQAQQSVFWRIPLGVQLVERFQGIHIFLMELSPP